MFYRVFNHFYLSLLFVTLFLQAYVNAQIDPLPSWNAGPAKSAIIQFVQEVTYDSSSNYVSPEERIATFDQDGTLWVEKPFYTQLAFAIDRIKILAPQHPEWKDQQILSILDGDIEKLNSLTEDDIAFIVTKTHAGISIEAFHDIVRQWLKQAIHPRFKKPYTDLVYQPMLEVIRYFKEHDFKTYIVSGGGQEFMRAYAETVYGIPPEQVIGSAEKVQYQYQSGEPALLKLPEILFIDDKQGKPEGINLIIGRHPIAAFGNSDGDRQMLEWAQSSKKSTLEVLVHHDDAEREYAYDKHSKIGTFSASLMNEAQKNDWLVVSMKRDWRIIFPWQATSITQNIVFQPQFKWADQTTSQQGTGSFIQAPNGEVVALTSAHFINFLGLQLIEVSWLDTLTNHVVATSTKSVGIPGREGSSRPLDLRTDYFLLALDKKVPSEYILELDSHNEIDVGERVWFPNKNSTDRSNEAHQTGTVVEANNRYIAVSLDKNTPLQSRSGTPIISQRTNKVIGILTSGGSNGHSTIIYLTPAYNIYQGLLEAEHYFRLPDVVGKQTTPKHP